MKYTREIPYTKDGKELPYETVSKNKKKLRNRINSDLQCPMNWLEEWLDKIQNISSNNAVPTKDFFVKMQGDGNRRQMSKIRELVETYDRYVRYYTLNCNDNNYNVGDMVSISREILDRLCKIRIGNIITINRLIETAFGLETNNNKSLFYKTSQISLRLLTV